tara:strand:+ start:4019 stop:4285 length:267 start_codon:yes stop_codon:yes gene_type:complete
MESSNYKTASQITPTVLVGFDNFELPKIKFGGYYRKGFLRREKHITLDFFDKVTLHQLSRAKDGELSLECTAEYKNKTYLVQFIYNKP